MALSVLVTGGSGNLGSQVVEAVRRAGHTAIACDLAPPRRDGVVWDISRQAAPESECDPDVVVHAAASLGRYGQSLADSASVMEVNVLGTRRVAQWAASRRVRRFIMISGAIVYGEWSTGPRAETDPVQPWLAGSYAVSKWCAEQIAELVTAAGCELTILRLSSLYGPGYRNGLIQRLVAEGRGTGRIRLRPPLDDGFDLLHVKDAARTVARAVESRPTGLWNLGAGRIATLEEMARICAERTRAVCDPLAETSSRAPLILNWVDDRLARRALGHGNAVSLEEGIGEIAGVVRGES